MARTPTRTNSYCEAICNWLKSSHFFCLGKNPFFGVVVQGKPARTSQWEHSMMSTLQFMDPHHGFSSSFPFKPPANMAGTNQTPPTSRSRLPEVPAERFGAGAGEQGPAEEKLGGRGGGGGVKPGLSFRADSPSPPSLVVLKKSKGKTKAKFMFGGQPKWIRGSFWFSFIHPEEGYTQILGPSSYPTKRRHCNPQRKGVSCNRTHALRALGQGIRWLHDMTFVCQRERLFVDAYCPSSCSATAPPSSPPFHSALLRSVSTPHIRQAFVKTNPCTRIFQEIFQPTSTAGCVD